MRKSCKMSFFFASARVIFVIGRWWSCWVEWAVTAGCNIWGGLWHHSGVKARVTSWAHSSQKCQVCLWCLCLHVFVLVILLPPFFVLVPVVSSWGIRHLLLCITFHLILQHFYFIHSCPWWLVSICETHCKHTFLFSSLYRTTVLTVSNDSMNFPLAKVRSDDCRRVLLHQSWQWIYVSQQYAPDLIMRIVY